MNKEKIAILKRLNSGKYNNLSFPNNTPNIQKQIDILYRTGYIEVCKGMHYYVLTPKAYEAIDSFESSHALQIKNDIKCWITTCIALAAFVKSFFF